MPAHDYSPLPALLTEVDWRPWSGQVVMYRGATPDGDVTLPTFAADEGLFEDLLQALNGAGSHVATAGSADLIAQATAEGAGGTWSVTIDPTTDRLRIRCTGVGAAAFTVTALSTAMGFPVAVVNSAPIAGGHEALAPAEWRRGTLRGTLGAGDHLSITQGLATWLWPSDHYQAQCLVTLLRARGIADADDQAGALCLEALDQAEHGQRMRWGITAEGHVYSAWRTGTMDVPEWADTAFRDALGFSGLEEVQAAGLLDFVVADHPAATVWCPTTPLQDYYPIALDRSRAHRTRTGAYAALHQGLVHQASVEVLVDGPANPRNLLAHVRRRWWPQARVGRPVTLYPLWGERRRRLLPHEVDLTQPAYSLLHSSEDGGRIGRLRCRVSLDADARQAFDFGADRVEDRIAVRLTLDERED
jgi:hypothetical protein